MSKSVVVEITPDGQVSVHVEGVSGPTCVPLARRVVQLRNPMEQVARLNFTDDVELEVMLSDVYAELDREAQKRDVDEMEQALHDVATVTRATLLSLGEQPRSAREAGIPDEPAPSLVREARKRLGLDEGTQALPEMPARSRRVDAPKQAAMSL